MNPLTKIWLKKQNNLKLHVGCGGSKLAGFVNIDVRWTPAADVTSDLNTFDIFRDNVDLIFSNAFFEHLLRDRRLAHLRGAYHALTPGGAICYIGLPNFPVVARAYLEKWPGTVGPTFDLFNVYRYTHGNPEQAVGWYLEQLHKSLFDKEELEKLLRDSGFESAVIFQYAYPNDANPVPVNLGFYASKRMVQIDLKRACSTFLAQYPERVAMKTLEFL